MHFWNHSRRDLIVLALFILLWPVGRAGAAEKMYWADQQTNKVQRANLDGSDVEDLVTNVAQPHGIALDVPAGKMYWTAVSANKIQRANLDGTDVVDVLTGLGGPVSIALDVSGGKMYWTEANTSRIQRSNLDGSSVEQLVTGLVLPVAIALDVAGGKMYWTDISAFTIQRANLNGTDVQNLVDGVHSAGIALDRAGGKMYWTDFDSNSIQRANLDGTTIENVVTGLSNPQGIALDLSNQKMYWTDDIANRIQRANLDGTSLDDLVTTGLGNPAQIAVEVFVTAAVCTGDYGPGFFGEFVVGNDGVGSCVLEDAQTSYLGLLIGQHVTGSGVVTMTNSQVSLTGNINRLSVGVEGTGVMTVSQGTIVDGSGGSCDPGTCNFFVASAAGSSGALTVTDPGTRLVTVNDFAVGGGGVFTVANDGFDLGIPGGSTIASFFVLNDAIVESENAEISTGATGGSPTGTESTDTTVSVDGLGSRWMIEGGLAVSPGPNATSLVTVSNGGLLSASQFSLATHATSQGTLRVQDGALVQAGGLRVAEEAGSRATIDISNARLTNHALAGQWIIGGLGQAKLSIKKGGQVANVVGFGVIVAQGTESKASISLNGAGSLFDAGGVLGLGWDLNTNAPGGACDVSLDAGTVIRAAQIVIGPRCTIKGKGTLQGTVINNGGTIAPKVSIVP